MKNFNLAKFNTDSVLALIAGIAMAVAAVGASQFCFYWYHQPEMPESVRNLSR